MIFRNIRMNISQVDGHRSRAISVVFLCRKTCRSLQMYTSQTSLDDCRAYAIPTDFLWWIFWDMKRKECSALFCCEWSPDAQRVHFSICIFCHIDHRSTCLVFSVAELFPLLWAFCHALDLCVVSDHVWRRISSWDHTARMCICRLCPDACSKRENWIFFSSLLRTRRCCRNTVISADVLLPCEIEDTALFLWNSRRCRNGGQEAVN